MGKESVTTESGKPTTTVKVDQYIVTIGFEVNFTAAFVERENGIIFKKKELTQISDIDYGHAFFYLTKNDKIITVMSFGPSGRGKVGWFDKGQEKSYKRIGAVKKDGYADARPGTPDYGVHEVVHVFRIPVTEEVAQSILSENTAMREKISSGKMKYTAWQNDTCAATAYSVLKGKIKDLPDGQGAVVVSGKALPLHIFNPYMWHHNLEKSANKYTQVVYPTIDKSPDMFGGQYIWDLAEEIDMNIGSIDPLVKKGYVGSYGK